MSTMEKYNKLPPELAKTFYYVLKHTLDKHMFLKMYNHEDTLVLYEIYKELYDNICPMILGIERKYLDEAFIIISKDYSVTSTQNPIHFRKKFFGILDGIMKEGD